MRVEPPTRITWSIWPLVRPASLMACSNGTLQRSSRSAVISWNLARLSVVQVERAGVGGGDEGQVDLGLLDLRQLDLGLLGRLLEALQGHVVLAEVDAVVALEPLDQPVDDRWSQSSPPRLVSPWVDLTSNTPSPISSTDTSKVPPPRSNTRIVWSCASLSRP
jgi:hypothetical protein